MKYFLCAALAVASAGAAIPLAAQQVTSTTATSKNKDVTQKLYLVKTDSIKKYAILQHGKESPRAVAVGDTIAGYHLKEVGKDMAVLVGRDSKLLVLKQTASSSSVDEGAPSPAAVITPAKSVKEYISRFYDLTETPGITDQEIVAQAKVLNSELPKHDIESNWWVSKNGHAGHIKDGILHYWIYAHAGVPGHDSIPNP